MAKPLVKICRVCGDRARGFNFNGLCCESCKSFFRRNALRHEKYVCLKSGGCPIDFTTRKCCTRCRLDKCVAIGMDRHLIYSKLERLAHGRMNINNNARQTPAPCAMSVPVQQCFDPLLHHHHHQQQQQHSDSLARPSSEVVLLPVIKSEPVTSITSTTLRNAFADSTFNPNTTTMTMLSEDERMFPVHQPCAQPCEAIVSSTTSMDQVLDDNIRSNIVSACHFADNESIAGLVVKDPSEVGAVLPELTAFTEAITPTEHSEPDQCDQMEHRSVPRRLCYSIELNLYELDRIKEVTNATSVATFYSADNFEVIGEVKSLMKALNCAELYIRKIVKLCKNIAAFKTLNMEDQLVVLKSVFTEMLVVCFSYSCRPEEDGFPVIQDENRKSAVLIKLDVLAEANSQEVAYFCRENIRKFHDELENDSTIRDLQLFKPRAKLTCVEVMNYNYTGYNWLMHRYLEHKYKNVERAQAKAAKLFQMLSAMSPVRDVLEGMFTECDHSQLALLLNELFDTPRTATSAITQSVDNAQLHFTHQLAVMQ